MVFNHQPCQQSFFVAQFAKNHWHFIPQLLTFKKQTLILNYSQDPAFIFIFQILLKVNEGGRK